MFYDSYFGMIACNAFSPEIGFVSKDLLRGFHKQESSCGASEKVMNSTFVMVAEFRADEE